MELLLVLRQAQTLLALLQLPRAGATFPSFSSSFSFFSRAPLFLILSPPLSQNHHTKKTIPADGGALPAHQGRQQLGRRPRAVRAGPAVASGIRARHGEGGGFLASRGEGDDRDERLPCGEVRADRRAGAVRGDEQRVERRSLIDINETKKQFDTQKTISLSFVFYYLFLSFSLSSFPPLLLSLVVPAPARGPLRGPSNGSSSSARIRRGRICGVLCGLDLADCLRSRGSGRVPVARAEPRELPGRARGHGRGRRR